MAVTELYPQETYGIPFGVITSDSHRRGFSAGATPVCPTLEGTDWAHGSSVRAYSARAMASTARSPWPKRAIASRCRSSSL